jgi:hypothetical protein
VVIFEGVLILRFLVKLFAWALILRKLKKQNKNFTISNLGRIIDNVDFFFMNSHVYILFSLTVMCRFYFSSTVAWLLIGNNANVISMW